MPRTRRTMLAGPALWTAIGMSLTAGWCVVTKANDAAKATFRIDGRETTGEIRWNAANRTLTLHDGEGREIPWPATAVEFGDPKPRPPRAVAVENPDDVVAVLGFRERLSGRMGAVVDRGKIEWSIGDSSRRDSTDPASAFAWLFNPGKTVLLFRGFEAADDPATFEPSFPAPEGRRMLRLAGTRREPVRQSGDGSSKRTLLQVAFEESAIGTDHGPLTFAAYGGAADEPIASVTIRSDGETWVVESPQDDRTASARIPRKPGPHRLSMFIAEDRVRFCVDESVALRVPTRATSGPIHEVAITADTAKPRAVDSLAVYEFGSAAHALQWPVAEDLLKLSGGHEWIGAVDKFADGEWSLIEGESRRKIPLGLTAAWLPPARQAVGTWAEGPVMEVTFFGPSGSLWQTDVDAGHLASLGLVEPPGKSQDRVEGAVEGLDAAGLRLKLSQGGVVTVPLSGIVRMAARSATALRVIDSRPRHLGDEVDLRVIPPEPLGGRLELTFEATAAEAGWPLELAVDAVEVLGLDAPTFGNLIRMGELLTEIRLNDTLLGNLNEKVSATNQTPERLRFDIPEGLVKAGVNRVEFRQKGRSNDPNYLDDLGILGVRLYRKAN